MGKLCQYEVMYIIFVLTILMFNKINLPFLSIYIKQGEKQQLTLFGCLLSSRYNFFLKYKMLSLKNGCIFAIDLPGNFTHTSSAFLCTNSSSDFGQLVCIGLGSAFPQHRHDCISVIMWA